MALPQKDGKADLPVEIRRLPALPDVTDQAAMQKWWEQTRRVLELSANELYSKIPAPTVAANS